MKKCVLLLVLAVCANASAGWTCWDPNGISVDQSVVPADTKRSNNPTRLVFVAPKKVTVSVENPFSVPDVGVDGGYSTASICVDEPDLVSFLGERRSALSGGLPMLGASTYNYSFKALKPGKLRVLVMAERLWGKHDKANRVTTFVIAKKKGPKK